MTCRAQPRLRFASDGKENGIKTQTYAQNENALCEGVSQ